MSLALRLGGRLEKRKPWQEGGAQQGEEQGLLGGGNEDVKGRWAAALNARVRRLPLSDQHQE